ncbi:MAG: GNAT family N-acetyltransferase, partial [Anaerolineae bacterium]
LRAGAREFTLRFHRANHDLEIDHEQLTFKAEALLERGKAVFYDPQVEQRYEKTVQKVGGVDIGKPDAKEASAVRTLQQEIWGGDQDSLYPADIYSRDFRAGTALVARLGGEPVGFLLGFYKFDGSPLPETWSQRHRGDLRLESQLLGVLGKYRGRGIGSALKKVQAENAQREGIGIVNWTVDPLQYGNAILNFGRLKAVAFNFHPDYYAFRNVLNQVPASRFGVNWLVDTERVKHVLSSTSRAIILNLHDNATVRRINRGWAEYYLEEDAQLIAVEIPADWTRLQREHLQEALRWREVTDTLLQHYLGHEEGRYIVTGVGEDGRQKYLIAERVDLALLDRLAT